MKPYFKTADGAPAPLRARCKRRVRFEEVDPLGIIWHGRYASYFEDARVNLGHQYGVGYLDFQRNDVAAPVKQLHFDFVKPLRFGEAVEIEAVLHYSEASRINYSFTIFNDAKEVATTGYTVQLFVDLEGQLLVTPPDFFHEFLQRWKAGEF